ncbi:4'-phosphopantetheinyl transferase [Chryseolinea serpens]|uniref:4'-phosphopantetheinyl transferase n=1 Tax=Chryseolinea serpens TaxID=947013 RepID=A0A1M5VA24_9BACT|nr:4'-phosphopantetheinyl transferase superfamily protein [Chryseolinea serpens]SHH72080.1 4'-phosphopantetheinyl transferase [Chryseolinea serpens]
MIHVLHTRFEERLNTRSYEQHLRMLPPCLRDKIGRFQNWKDAQASLLGKLLLLRGLKIYDLDHLDLSDLAYSKFSRPYFGHGVDFNISHSGDVVVCAISMTGRVGVDIEAMRVVTPSDFELFFDAAEMQRLAQADNVLDEFYTLWTKKEAVMKADGKGLSIPLKDVRLMGNGCAYIENYCWYLEPLDLYAGYKVHVAADFPIHDGITTGQYAFEEVNL